MSDDEAKRILRVVLEDYPLGSVLHLLSEVAEEAAHDAVRDEDEGRAEQLVHAAHTLFVVGLGLHSILPQ
jgi:hypothetical protein